MVGHVIEHFCKGVFKSVEKVLVDLKNNALGDAVMLMVPEIAETVHELNLGNFVNTFSEQSHHRYRFDAYERAIPTSPIPTCSR